MSRGGDKPSFLSGIADWVSGGELSRLRTTSAKQASELEAMRGKPGDLSGAHESLKGAHASAQRKAQHAEVFGQAAALTGASASAAASWYHDVVTRAVNSANKATGMMPGARPSPAALRRYGRVTGGAAAIPPLADAAVSAAHGDYATATGAALQSGGALAMTRGSPTARLFGLAAFGAGATLRAMTATKATAPPVATPPRGGSGGTGG